MWATRATRRCTAPIDALWFEYTEAREWPRWAKDIRSAAMNGAMGKGATGSVKFRGLPEARFTITASEKPRFFGTRMELPLLRIQFEHHLAPGPDGTTVITECVDFHGLLGFLLGPIERLRFRLNWPAAIAEMDRLASRARRDPATVEA